MRDVWVPWRLMLELSTYFGAFVNFFHCQMNKHHMDEVLGDKLME